MSAVPVNRLVQALLPALLVAACATAEPRYLKPDTTDAKSGEELQSCRAESQEAMSDLRKGAGRQDLEQAEIIDQCMKAKGFTRASP